MDKSKIFGRDKFTSIKSSGWFAVLYCSICFLDPNSWLKSLIPINDNNIHNYIFHINAPKYNNL